jgi:hypothetical protein
MQSKCHFWNGYLSKMVISVAKFYMITFYLFIDINHKFYNICEHLDS